MSNYKKKNVKNTCGNERRKKKPVLLNELDAVRPTKQTLNAEAM
jgi:hypothetical protein